MELFNEIDDLSDFFLLEKTTKLDSPVEGYEDLQTRYSSLHEDYAKEIENSKKVGKCLVKCLKFYSKLCKKYEAQQKIIANLEETIKEKIISLEEAQRNEEKMKGLVQVYRSERAFYMGQASSDLRKDKEILLDICCRLIGESVRNNNIRNLANLILRKFKKDLDDEKINLLKRKNEKKCKNESECDVFGDVKASFIRSPKNEIDFKTEEEKYSEQMRGEDDRKNDPLDLSMCRGASETKRYPEVESGRRWRTVEEFGLPLVEDLFSPQPRCCVPGSDDKEKEKHEEETIREGPFQVGMECRSEERAEEEGTGGGLVAPVRKEAAAVTSSRLSGRGAENVRERGECPFESVMCPGSVFDVSDGCSLNAFGLMGEGKEEEDAWVGAGMECSDVVEGKDRTDEKGESGKNMDVLSVEELRDSEEEDEDEDEDEDEEEEKGREEEQLQQQKKEEEEEKELMKILREMSSVRLPSPVKDISDSCVGVRSRGCSLSKGEVGQKRHLTEEESSSSSSSSCKSKRLKGGEESGSGGLLDSIMSAMSLQNEEFKWKGSGGGGGEEGSCGGGDMAERSCRFSNLGTRTYSRRKKLDGGSLKENSSASASASVGVGVGVGVGVSVSVSVGGGCQGPRTMPNRQRALENVVMEEIKNFVSSPISCKEDADKNVKHCLSVLASKSEEVIAKCIVATVLENVDEVVECFERPAPPLTKTQHRLIVLLSVLRSFHSGPDRISPSILSLISHKLFPDNFFWPDDSIEAATRFYAALCRARNESKLLWKFCLQAMTDMKQRCPLLVFTVLKTWPDVLHDATTLKNNLLALTLVNLFLHMPKAEGLRNFNQGRKLIALKHLLMNFYQFKVEDTIEGYANKLVDAVERQEVGAEKSVVLLCRCRDIAWTTKHVLPRLKSTLSEWCEGKTEDAAAAKVLSVMKQICPVLVQEVAEGGKVRDLVHCLSQILTCGKKSHASEVSTVEVLLELKQYPEARKMIREWIPKSPITECLRNEIINASAENILRELRLNKKREGKSVPPKKRLKKQSKKSKKGKKKKGKKGGNNKEDVTDQTGLVGVSS